MNKPVVRIEEDGDFRGTKRVFIHEHATTTQQGKFAMRLIEHFAIVAAKPDGVDEAGRQKLALLEPQEVVDRAFAIAECAFKALEATDQMVNLPIPEPFNRKQKDEL